MYEDSTRTTVLGLSVCSSNDTEPSGEPQERQLGGGRQTKGGRRKSQFTMGSSHYELPQYPSVSKGGRGKGGVSRCVQIKNHSNICNQKPSEFRPLHPCVPYALFSSKKLVLLCVSMQGHPQLLQNHPTVPQQCLKADKTARSTCFEFLTACDPSLS